MPEKNQLSDATTSAHETPAPPASIPLSAARTAAWAGVVYLGLTAMLHLIKADDVDPSWQTTSEYAIGKHGWIMVVAFLAQAIAYVALAAMFRSQVRTIPGRLGLGLLLLAALGAAVSGVFVADPMDTPSSEMTTSGTLHGIGAGSALFLYPLAVAVVSVSLVRKNNGWAPARRWLVFLAALAVAALVMFMAVQAAIVPSDGQFGPAVKIGWPERILVVAYGASVVSIAWCTIRLRNRTSSAAT